MVTDEELKKLGLAQLLVRKYTYSNIDATNVLLELGLTRQEVDEHVVKITTQINILRTKQLIKSN